VNSTNDTITHCNTYGMSSSHPGAVKPLIPNREVGYCQLRSSCDGNSVENLQRGANTPEDELTSSKWTTKRRYVRSNDKKAKSSSSVGSESSATKLKISLKNDIPASDSGIQLHVTKKKK
jgi:hypothetical protein